MVGIKDSNIAFWLVTAAPHNQNQGYLRGSAVYLSGKTLYIDYNKNNRKVGFDKKAKKKDFIYKEGCFKKCKAIWRHVLQGCTSLSATQAGMLSCDSKPRSHVTSCPLRCLPHLS